MKKAVIPGGFDPITLGHVHLIERTAALFDEVIVCVLKGKCGSAEIFPYEFRLQLVESAVGHMPNVKICTANMFYELPTLYDEAVIVRAVKNNSDFEKEIQLSNTLKTICPTAEIMYLFSDVEHTHISSSAVVELLTHDVSLEAFVSPAIEKKLKDYRSKVSTK